MKRKVSEYIITAGGFDDKTNWRGLEPLDALREQVGAVMGDRMDGRPIRTTEQAGEYLARGGQWAIYNEDVKKDLRDVFGVKNADKIENYFDLYCSLCGWAVDYMLRKKGGE